MKINVNVYNEILSYEGTPAELAEFISYGVFSEYVPEEEMLECGYEDEDEYDNEDCGCDEATEVYENPTPETVEVVIEEAKEEPVAEVHISDDEPFDAKKHKEYVRKQIRKMYPDLSNEEFNDYYNFVADWVSVFDNLDFLKQK